MVRLLHVTVFEGVGTVSHKEPYACAELLDITGRPIKKERVKTSVSESLKMPRMYKTTSEKYQRGLPCATVVNTSYILMHVGVDTTFGTGLLQMRW